MQIQQLRTTSLDTLVDLASLASELPHLVLIKPRRAVGAAAVVFCDYDFDVILRGGQVVLSLLVRHGTVSTWYLIA